jgi:hypothetical protein
MLYDLSSTQKNAIMWLFILMLAAGCGGAPAKSTTPEGESSGNDSSTPAPSATSDDAGQTTATAEQSVAPAAPARQPAVPMCTVEENDDESNIVFSRENDWYFTVSKDSNVDCQNNRGTADVEMAGIHINVYVQPLSDELTLEQAAEQFINGYIQGVSGSISFEAPLSFESRKIGEYGRQSYFSDGQFVLENTTFHLVTSITATTNENNQGVFHTVFWRLEANDFKENHQLAMDTIDTVSSSWFRLSDINEEGAITNFW